MGSKLILSIKLPTQSRSQVWSCVLYFPKAAERCSILRLGERTLNFERLFFFFLFLSCTAISKPAVRRQFLWTEQWLSGTWMQTRFSQKNRTKKKKKENTLSNEMNQDLDQREGRIKSIFRRTLMALLSRLDLSWLSKHHCGCLKGLYSH